VFFASVLGSFFESYVKGGCNVLSVEKDTSFEW
jgi:hypothetical protein